MERLPLFPLNTVLFPDAPLPLHIFEERYKLMVRRCIDASAPFGVVLIRTGVEAGGEAEPYSVGTTARIVRVHELPDGRMNIVCAGERRIRVDALDRSAPYLQGDVELLEDIGASTPAANDAAERVAALYGEHYRLLLAVTGQWAQTLDLPQDPRRLADHIAAQLPLPVETKQTLLELLDVAERLGRLADLLGDTVRELSERWNARQQRKYAGGSLN
jgi:Lon protease-like protein